ncbi:arginine--tRNA ligase [Candidatus Gottesmanbacteria bacterium RBG_16_37_8]|uniref:Arginine--tRNA ligase n=1 Tax=Candidatus Gottesmanbacteria bacterium RBG_16_37_8 TaxID=1798371 RepID=A0A1F5YUB6_9BACT|nr:MAG: arginine--tRNA ligase [Candidatus Gottesmanbacteria bacterium RBG_16_37_8]
MKFSIDSNIFERFPGVEIEVLVITGMNNRGHNKEILNLLRKEEKRQKEKLSNVELRSLPEISSWRRIYDEFGSDPKDFRSSVEALLRRARGGEKPIPQINNLVDLYNYISLKYHLPAGAEDLEKAEGDIWLTFAIGVEKGVYIGGDKIENCDPGEVIYKDKSGFICRRWNWREADRTKIDEETSQAVLVIERVPVVSEEVFKEAIVEAEELIKKFLGGKVRSYILKDKNPSVIYEVIIDKSRRSEKKEREVSKRIKENKTEKKIDQKMSNPVGEKLAENPPILQEMVKKAVEKAAGETFLKAKISKNVIKIEHPRINNYGDYSTNLALILAGQLKMKPIECAEKLSRKIEEYIRQHQLISFKADSNGLKSVTFKVNDILESAKFELPGFVNLNLAKKWLINQMIGVLNNEWIVRSGQNIKEEKNLPLHGFKTIVEFTDPNPFKDFHIGHLYSNSVGESLCRLFESQGAEVKRANYFGDVGMHVAKSVWGMRKQIDSLKITVESLEKWSLRERIEFLQKSYARGAKSFEEEEEAKAEITRINYLIYISAQEYLRETKGWERQIDYRKYISVDETELAEISHLFRIGREWSLGYFETIYKKLGTKFDFYYPESVVGEYGAKFVREALKKGVFDRSEGAIVFRGDKYGFHTRVFINKLGLPTYEAKELGLAPAKFKDYPYDFSLIVTGKEIDEYFRVLLKALSLIDKKLAAKTEHLGHGMVRLPKGKMSSRSGEIVTGESLIEEVKNKVKEKLDTSGGVGGRIDYPRVEYEDIAEKAAIAAIKYSFLKVGLPADLVFDLEKSVEFEGDSGPYLLYTYARCKSVLRKAKTDSGSKLNVAGLEKYDLNEEELELLRSFYQFEEVVWEAARSMAPNLICSYLYDLAQQFNLFYQKHSILGSKKEEAGPAASGIPLRRESKNETVEFRLAMTEATEVIIKRGLYLLGIETVERM